MGQALQTLTAANVALRGAGLSAVLEAQLHSYVHQLHACIDQMANIKEFRIPQASRRGRPCWRDKIVVRLGCGVDYGRPGMAPAGVAAAFGGQCG